MLNAARRRFIAVLSTLLCVVALAASLWPSSVRRVQTEDRNHDGRPDVWRTYDARGELRHVTIDANFDGRPDREEQYEGGALVRRETDRNFDQLTDLVEEFDPITQQHVRSVADVNFDGVADLLVFFKDGRPDHVEWAAALPPAQNATARQRPAADPGRLTPFEDPFSATAAWHTSYEVRSTDSVGVPVVAVTVGRPTHGRVTAPPIVAVPTTDSSPLAAARDAAAPRGPPRLV